MRKNLVNELLVFDTAVRRIGESLPRERSECFGYDLCGTTAMSTGFYRAAFGSMSPKAPTFGEYSFQTSPQGAYFWWAQVIAMDGMYAGFAAVRRAGAKTGHGRPSFFWCFVLTNSFSSAFAPPGRSHQNPVLAVWMMRHPDEYTVTNSPGANLDSFSWPA